MSPTQLSGYVGFDTITKQIENKLLKKGFTFNVMLVGRGGLGKSTFINTLFAGHLADSQGTNSAKDFNATKTTELVSSTHSIEENGVNLKVTVTDTPGYGDLVNNDQCWEPIVKYIKDQYATYLRKELTPVRERFILDFRVHCVLFFIAPTGHAPLDITVMKKISEVANVIPVIAKSDSLTMDERDDFKKRIRDELIFHQIRVFSPQQLESKKEIGAEETMAYFEESLIPHCIVGSERSIVINGKAVRGRRTRFDESHCEFVKLREFVTREHLQDLIESTTLFHYEAFRSRQLLALKESSVGQVGGQTGARVASKVDVV